MRTIAPPPKGDHMWMFGKEEDIRDFPFHTSRPEGMLKIPGLFVIHQSKIYDISLILIPHGNPSQISNFKVQMSNECQMTECQRFPFVHLDFVLDLNFEL